MVPQLILKVAGLIRGSCICEGADSLRGMYVDLNQASEMTCRTPEFSQLLPSQLLAAMGHLLNLSDQLRKKFSLQLVDENGDVHYILLCGDASAPYSIFASICWLL